MTSYFKMVNYINAAMYFIIFLIIKFLADLPTIYSSNVIYWLYCCNLIVSQELFPSAGLVFHLICLFYLLLNAKLVYRYYQLLFSLSFSGNMSTKYKQLIIRLASCVAWKQISVSFANKKMCKHLSTKLERSNTIYGVPTKTDCVHTKGELNS